MCIFSCKCPYKANISALANTKLDPTLLTTYFLTTEILPKEPLFVNTQVQQRILSTL